VTHNLAVCIQNVLQHHQLLSSKLLDQGISKNHVMLSFKMFWKKSLKIPKR